MSLPIALQLWSVQLGEDKDIFATLEKVAEIGFDGVEMAGFFGKTAVEIKEKADELGLKIAGAHTPYDQIIGNTEQVIADMLALGSPYVICPYATFDNVDQWLDLIKELAALKPQIEAAGLQLLFHNHAEEFQEVDGRHLMDIIMDNMTAGEFDTYWIEFAGLSAVEYLKKYNGRVPLVHIKDLDETRSKSTVVGEGILDIDGIVKQAKAIGTKWLVLEQEQFTKDQFESVAEGLVNLKRINQG